MGISQLSGYSFFFYSFTSNLLLSLAQSSTFASMCRAYIKHVKRIPLKLLWCKTHKYINITPWMNMVFLLLLHNNQWSISNCLFFSLFAHIW